MDSPEAAKNDGPSTSIATTIPTSSSESPPVQESPFLRYVNNLSPIKPVKAAHVAQGFIGLNSPPLVFTSPRISSLRETQFLQRPQCSRLTSEEISQSDNGDKSRIDNLDDSKKLRSQLPGKFTTDTQKDFDIKNDENTQHSSSSLCVDEYLADPVDIDGIYSVHSVNQDVKQSNDAVELSLTGLTHSKETIPRFDRKYGSGDKEDKPLLLSEESEMIHQEMPMHVDEAGKIEGRKKDVERPSLECRELEASMSADLAFEKQHCDDSITQSQGNELQDHCDCTAQLMTDLQDVKESEDCGQVGPTLHVSAETVSQDGFEASQKHRGIRRRCLQFEEAATTAFGSSSSSPFRGHISEDSVSSAPSSESRDTKASRMELVVASSKKKVVKLSEPVTSLFPPRFIGHFPVTNSKPSGIGLHLNSIVNAMPLGRASSTGMRLAEGNMGLQGTSISRHRVQNITRGLISSNMDGESSAGTEDERHEINASIAASSVTSESPSSIEPTTSLYPTTTSVPDKRKLSSEDVGNFEEFSQSSPRKKKKKTSSTTDDDGCKRCNCKKSKCLKLYCDCFAAGIYCAEPCSCQGCFNRPEYEDTVLETRQQIESRNPLAFAPKIVMRAPDFPSNNMEDDNLMTPSSARHKRGCNCKRSMCLKKYCECYQANVGCSSGCRCEGCKNVYGRKEDYVAVQHALSKERVSSRVEKGSHSSFHDELGMVANRTDLLHKELYDMHPLSPLTPSLQCSDHGKEVAKSRLLSGVHQPSVESDVTAFTSRAKFTKSPKNAESSLVLPETNETMGTDYCDWQLDCNNVIMDQSSPRSNSVTTVCQLSPPSNPQSMSGATSLSSKIRNWTHNPQGQPSHGSSRLLPGGSLRWRSSPITPMTGLGEAKYLHCLESDSGLYDILEDETPKILKEASTPTKSVKTSSPNQKRVSPPHSHLRERGSGSSGALRSGRKFILKAVPAFPPLTPCIDSRGNGPETSGTSTSK